MPDEKKDVTVAGSPPAEKGVTDAGSPPDRDIANVMAENKAKAEKISKLEARLDELEEAEKRRDLTAREEREKTGLEGDIKTEAKKLRNLKETQPWIEIAREEAERAGEEKAFNVMLNNELERANDFIDDKAFDHNTTPKELAKELQPYAMKYQDKRPSRRNELAYRDWVQAQSKVKSIEEREKALKEKEDAETKFRERAGRHVRDESVDQKFDNADAKKQARLLRELVQTDSSQ